MKFRNLVKSSLVAMLSSLIIIFFKPLPFGQICVGGMIWYQCQENTGLVLSV